MTEQGTELVTEAGRMLVEQEGVLPLFIGAARHDGEPDLLRDYVAAIESEARRLALAEGLDVERLARATRNAGYLFKRRDSRHQTPVYLEVAVEAIADEYARLTEEARHDPQ